MLGLAPYLILLVCPSLHLFHRHGGQHRDGHSHDGNEGPSGGTSLVTTVVTSHFADQLGLVARYVGVSLPMFAAWEVAQLPLYTIWEEQGVHASLLAALHCTAGDAAYSILAFGGALIAAAYVRRLSSALAVGTTTLLIGLAITAGIEIASTQWLERWNYGPLMPVDPIFGIGLSPLAQWTVVPAATLSLLRRRLRDIHGSASCGA